jgi:hypothetical protein
MTKTNLQGDPTGPAEQPYDPFDPKNLRVDQNFVASAGVKKAITNIPVKRADKQTFIRIHPADDGGTWSEMFHIIDLKNDREEYVVSQRMVAALASEIVMKQLRLYMTAQGDLGLMPLRLPGPDGRDNPWWSSLRDHCVTAEKKWVRIVPNQHVGAYDIWESVDALPEPDWDGVLGGLTYWECIKIAIRNYLIDKEDHPVVKRLRGKV